MSCFLKLAPCLFLSLFLSLPASLMKLSINHCHCLNQTQWRMFLFQLSPILTFEELEPVHLRQFYLINDLNDQLIIKNHNLNFV